MASVNIESVIIIVIAILYLDTLYPDAVAGEIVLHPASTVLQSHIFYGDITALYKPEQMRAGDSFVIPRFFLECPPSSVDSTISVDYHILS